MHVNYLMQLTSFYPRQEHIQKQRDRAITVKRKMADILWVKDAARNFPCNTFPTAVLLISSDKDLHIFFLIIYMRKKELRVLNWVIAR